MGKKVEKDCSDKENSLPSSVEKTIPLNATDDTDIIECSIVDNDKFLIKKRGKCTKGDDSKISKTPLKEKELKTSYKACEELRLSLRKSFGLDSSVEDKVSVKTPPLKRNSEKSNSSVKNFFLALNKTPEAAPCLSKTKLMNINQWLNENEVEIVKTPPFFNLSVTPARSSKKPLSSRRKTNKKRNEQDSSIDSEVEGVLKAVYGDDWKKENVQNRAKTEPKKSSRNLFTPSSLRKKSKKEVSSVRRPIFRQKKFTWVDEDSEKSYLNDSVVSGVKMITLDDSDVSEKQKETKVRKSYRTPRKKEPLNTSLDSVGLFPVNQKKSEMKTAVSGGKKTPKTPKTPKKTFLASLSVSTPTSRCHPDADYYKVNFKSKKEELVKKLYKLYNSEVFEGQLAEDMNFSWNVKLRGTAGYCYNKRLTKSSGEVTRLSRIEFSTKIVDRADRLRDTMIHELCHAGSWVIDGVLDGHGAVWTKWASKAMQRFPELPPIKRCHNYDIVSKYVYRCTGCGYSIKRHSKSINTERKRCGHCYGTLELLINKKKRGKGEVPEFDTTRTLPTPNKFAMFVKENYHTVKSSKGNAKHSEIMKALSEQYALMKKEKKSQD